MSFSSLFVGFFLDEETSIQFFWLFESHKIFHQWVTVKRPDEKTLSSRDNVTKQCKFMLQIIMQEFQHTRILVFNVCLQ